MEFGDADLVLRDDGRVVVERADDVIGISVGLLAQMEGCPVDGEGRLWLAGDPDYQYRPVGFAAPTPGGGLGWVVCRRVHHG